MAEFEYRTITIDCKAMECFQNTLTDELNHCGRDGWEVVSSFIQPRLGSSQYSFVGIVQKITIILKRQIVAEREMQK